MTYDDKNIPPFDPDSTPTSEQNLLAAEARNVVYDYHKRAYVDSDGCPMYDKYGQPF